MVLSIAQPDIVPFVLRIALAVSLLENRYPEVDRLLHLSDTAVNVFHRLVHDQPLPGPYPCARRPFFAFFLSIGRDPVSAPAFLGLAARFAALGLLFLTVYRRIDRGPTAGRDHITWAAMALAIMGVGDRPRLARPR